MAITFHCSKNNMKRAGIKLKLLLCLLLILATNNSFANRHYIFAFDVAYANKGCIDFISSDHMMNIIWKILNENDYTSNDYISVVSYSIDMQNPDFNRFVTVAKDIDGNEIKWARYTNADDAIGNFSWNWYDITVGHHKQHGRIASMQSLAKQYALKAVAKENYAADETWLLMITDDKVNGVGDSYVNEYNIVSTTGNHRIFSALKQEVFSFMGKFNEKIQFENIPIRNMSGEKTYNLGLGHDKLKIIAYKAKPTVLPSIQSVTNIPSPLPIKRVRGGFKLDMDVQSLSNDFIIDSLNLKIKDFIYSIPIKGNTAFIERNQPSIDNSTFIDKDSLSDGDSITLTMTMRYHDGYYNGMLITPTEDIYRQGMTLKTQYKMQDDAKVFGILPLIDLLWWFFPNNAAYAVFTWDVIIVLIFIGIICVIAYRIFRKITRYQPDNKDIIIKRM